MERLWAESDAERLHSLSVDGGSTGWKSKLKLFLFAVHLKWSLWLLTANQRAFLLYG